MKQNESGARNERRKPAYEKPAVETFTEKELAESVEAFGASLPVIP